MRADPARWRVRPQRAASGLRRGRGGSVREDGIWRECPPRASHGLQFLAWESSASSGQRPCSCRRSYEGRARSSGTPSRYRDPPEGHRLGGGQRDRPSPPVISSKPAIIRSVVVLPHPEGPRSTTNSPAWMESDTSLTAATVSKFLLRFSKSNSPNGCSPRLLPAIRELWGQGARRTPLFSRPVYYWCLTARNQSAQSLQDRPPLYH